MNGDSCREEWVDQRVTYVVEVDGRVSIVENVPARVCLETGERLYAPETAERLQQMIWGHDKPVRIIETPVFQFAA